MRIKRNIMINKAGGTAGIESKNYRVSIPSGMIRDLGVTPEDRAVILEFIDGKIIISKDHGDAE